MESEILMRKLRYAFTMVELIFVIVIMAILARFGVEFLTQAYSSFIFSQVNTTLQAQSSVALETVAARLQYRIRDSVIVRDNTNAFQALPGNAFGAAATVLEWVGSDADGLRGNNQPLWSGIIDLGISTPVNLNTPGTNTANLNILINTLSNGGSGINNAALFFRGSDSNINRYGWLFASPAFNDQSNSMHPIVPIGNNFQPWDVLNGALSSFNGEDVYEYYQLAWTAYAVAKQGTNLVLYYNYQPWEGENYLAGSQAIIMQNVNTFQAKGDGSVIKIQVCVFSNIVDGDRNTTTVGVSAGGYSVCKEKTIF